MWLADLAQLRMIIEKLIYFESGELTSLIGDALGDVGISDRTEAVESASMMIRTVTFALFCTALCSCYASCIAYSYVDCGEYGISLLPTISHARDSLSSVSDVLGLWSKAHFVKEIYSLCTRKKQRKIYLVELRFVDRGSAIVAFYFILSKNKTINATFAEKKRRRICWKI